jgi:hypothetical protein
MEDAEDDDIDESCSSADHSFSSRHRVSPIACHSLLHVL